MSTASPIPVVVDVETTGFGSQDRIVEIAAITLDPLSWEIVDEYDTLINPERDVGPTGVHGITASMVEAAPTFADILADIARRLQGMVLVAHNLPFDARMLRYEFERCGIAIDAGAGLCTYWATRQKLIFACEDRNISLSQQHRALADARATAELARHLRLQKLQERVRTAKVMRIAHIPQKPRQHTLRRGLADAGTSPMHRIVSRAHYPHCDEAVQQYLDMLDWVLDDGVIDAYEHSEIKRLARDLGITEEERMNAHQAYLDCIITAAQRDDIISAAEHELIVRIASQLEIRDAAIPEMTVAPAMSSIPLGSRICFTGSAIVHGEEVARNLLEALAERAGFQPVRSVTKSRCDLLVAADTSTSSSKARNARKWNIPILSTSDFLARCGNR